MHPSDPPPGLRRRPPAPLLKTPTARALVLGLGIAALLGVLHWLGVGLKLLFALAGVTAVMTLLLPRIAAAWAGDIARWLRGRFWAREEGRHHAFAGVALQVDDDGRHVWIDGAGLQRVLGRQESDDVLAARLSGRWRRDDDGTLMLRVDAVVAWLDSMPDRTDPRVLRLRHYLERELLYPAGRRRQGH